MHDRKFAQVRDGLAPGKQQAQLRLADGKPLSAWLSSPSAFDAAVEKALQKYRREEIVVHYEGRVD